MKLSELEVNKDYIIYNQFLFTKRHSVDIVNLSKHAVYKGKLVSKDKYLWNGLRPNTEKDSLKLAPKGQVKGVGLLFSVVDDNDKQFFFVSRLAGVICTADMAEALWKVEAERRAVKEAEAQAREELAREKKRQAKEHAERAKLTLPSTVKSLLGGRLLEEVTVEVPYYSDSAHARVSITLRDMERLIELIYDKKEEVA